MYRSALNAGVMMLTRGAGAEVLGAIRSVGSASLEAARGTSKQKLSRIQSGNASQFRMGERDGTWCALTGAMLQQKLATALGVWRRQGVEGVTRVSLETAGKWWRRGEAFELGKLVGRGSNHARIDGCRFELDHEAITPTLEHLLLTGLHEAPERTLIRRHLNPDLPLVEFGGAVGVVACIANRRLRDPSQHVVVEANPALLPVLEANRLRNRSRFFIVHRAVAYGAPAVSFRVAADVLASSARVPGSSTVTVRATTLEEILRQSRFSRCNLVCDIEGTEVDLVREEPEVLATAVEVLIMEVHDRIVGAAACAEMLRSLEKLGFELVDRSWDTVAMRRRQ
jgi:FkbM family methyltransferase